MRALFFIFVFLACMPLAACNEPANSTQTSTTATSEPAVEASKAAVVLLVDISQSFAPLIKEDQDALNIVVSDLVALAQNTWEPPITFYWSMITSNSLYATPPCGAAKRYQQRLVARASTGTDITRPEILTAWMQECVNAIIKRSGSVEKFTDISGAIQLAAQSNGSVNGQRVVIIYSDFAEDLAPGSEPTRFALHGETAVLLYRPDSTNDRRSPNSLFDRLKAWETKLKENGARTVCVRPIRGITPGSVANCFS